VVGPADGSPSPRRRLRSVGVAAASTAVLVAMVALAGRSSVAELLEWRSLDLRFRTRGALPADPEVLLVTIDERSFERLGLRYPFPPLLWADLVERLRTAGAAVIAFDLLYSEPSRECDPPDQDLRLAEVLRKAPDVVWAEQLRDGTDPQPPIPVIRDAVAFTGFVNLPDERDGRIRRIAPSRRGRPSFSIAVVEAYAGYLPDWWRTDQLRLIPFRGPAGTFPRVSLADVLAGDVPDEAIRDRVCLVGADFAASHDVFQTPFHRVDRPDSPGVEVHATVVGSILRGDRLAPSDPYAARVALVAVVLAIALLITLGRPWWALALQLAAVGTWLGWSYERFGAGEVVPVVQPVALLGVAFPTVAFVSSLLERRRRREITALFESYVDPSVVAWLLDHPDAVNLTGGRYLVTILESDIEGFTPITERLDPEVLVDHLNRYFEILVGTVLEHGGMHDKYVGDALLAVFGFPIGHPDHAARAVAAARTMLARVEDANRRWREEGLPELPTRIGIATGEVVIGTVGSSTRKSFTAIGEAVNLAARLEGLSTRHGTRILLDHATARRLPPGIPLRDLGEVAVKGFSRPARVFTPR